MLLLLWVLGSFLFNDVFPVSRIDVAHNRRSMGARLPCSLYGRSTQAFLLSLSLIINFCKIVKESINTENHTTNIA